MDRLPNDLKDFEADDRIEAEFVQAANDLLIFGAFALLVIGLAAALA